MGGRQSWRAGAVCNTVVFGLSGFDSHPSHQLFIRGTLMRKSQKRDYELDRTYDYADAYGFANAAANIGFVKKRARRRFRHQKKKECYIETMKFL